MNSEAFDNYIRDKVQTAENTPLEDWNPADTWNKLEQLSSTKTRGLFPWRIMAVAATLLIFMGSWGYMALQFQNKNQELSALQVETVTLKLQLQKMEMSLHKQKSLADARHKITEQLPSLAIVQPSIVKKEDVLIQIPQLPQLPLSLVQVNQRMALLQMQTTVIKTKEKQTISNRRSIEIITKPIKTGRKNGKFKIRFMNKPTDLPTRVPSRSIFAMK
jgi:cytoskeletal protein RodZ